MSPSILLIITGILNAPAIATLINRLFSRGKDQIEGDVTVGKEWERYALQAKRDRRSLEQQFEQVKKQMNELQAELLHKDGMIITLQESNTDLEERVKTLETELNHYRNRS